ncbi:MAG: hypothetical protein JSU87_03645 [Gemmatimonadota bacterium]|nr:MAG: hypothetical protein JSU87_03645 [Gemmatimonadota bacterium]
MKRIAFLAVAALALSIACGEAVDPTEPLNAEAARGQPSPNETCVGIVDADILALCEDTDAATYTSRNNADKDENGQIGKLARADTKLSENKICEAIGKLTEYRDKVVSLRAEDKIIEPAGVDLAALADAIITRLGGPCD